MCETVVLLTHDLRTDESIGKQRKPTQKVVLIFGRANIAPRYAINKIKKISLGRFFKIFLIVYSRIRHAQLGLLWRIRLWRYSKIKKSGKPRFVYFGSPSWTAFELYCCATMTK